MDILPFDDINALLGMYYPFFQIIHPKSDSQRKSLLEGVKQILLFRSLEPEQLTEVLDAMFERKVTPNEYIIRQGDDGDNFYVVERFVPDNKHPTNKHTRVILFAKVYLLMLLFNTSIFPSVVHTTYS